MYAFLSVFESAVNAVYWFRALSANLFEVSLLISASILLYIQVCPCPMDGSSSDWVHIRKSCYQTHVLLTFTIKVALKLSFAPSSTQCSHAISPRVAPLLPIFALKRIRQPNLTQYKAASDGSYGRVSNGLSGWKRRFRLMRSDYE